MRDDSQFIGEQTDGHIYLSFAQNNRIFTLMYPTHTSASGPHTELKIVLIPKYACRQGILCVGSTSVFVAAEKQARREERTTSAAMVAAVGLRRSPPRLLCVVFVHLR